MNKLIVILLVIIILILCPVLLVVGLISIGALVSILFKILMFLMPLLVLTILILVLIFVDRIFKKKSVLLGRTIIYTSIFFSLIISVILYLNNAIFISYSLIFCTIIFYILQSDTITLRILVVILAFLWSGAIGLESHILFGDFLELNREIPSSAFTLTILSAPFILPIIFSPVLAIMADWRKVKVFWTNNYIMIFIIIGICICGFSCGFLLANVMPDIIQKVFMIMHKNTINSF